MFGKNGEKFKNEKIHSKVHSLFETITRQVRQWTGNLGSSMQEKFGFESSIEKSKLWIKSDKEKVRMDRPRIRFFKTLLKIDSAEQSVPESTIAMPAEP